jgi:two-component system sensor histidine kinase BaeS
MTLRRRMLVYLALAAVASCALTVSVAIVLVRHRIAAQRMTALERQADLVAAVGGAPGSLGGGQQVYSLMAAGAGQRAARTRRVGPAKAALILAAIPPSGDGEGAVNVMGRDLLYVARATPAGRVVLVRPAGLAFGEWRPFLWSLVLAGIGGALLAVVLSGLLARRLTRPLRELGRATTAVASGQAGVAVPVRGSDELAQLASSFNDMSVELSRAREAQRSFLESVSHELKTPLTSIRGYAEALEEGAVPPADGGRVIAAEAERLERLVRDLLDLAHFGRSGFAVARDPVDLGALVARAVERHLPRARELGVSLRSVVEGEAWALGDPDRLLQVTSNLIENALRLTPTGGTVTVTASRALLSVSDSGPGLAPEDIARAFDRFYLYDRYRSERAVGTGLGLAIVAELVSGMGGTVEAASPAGGGTRGARFTVKLTPAAVPTPARYVPSGAPPPCA